jgi:hypothetical protein
LPDEGDAIDKVSVTSDERVDIRGEMDRIFLPFEERDPVNPCMDTEDDHVFVKVQDVSTDTSNDTDISTPSHVIFPIDSSCELDHQVDETIIPGVGIVSSFSSVVVLAFHTRLFSRLIPFLDLFRTKAIR